MGGKWWDGLDKTVRSSLGSVNRGRLWIYRRVGWIVDRDMGPHHCFGRLRVGCAWIFGFKSWWRRALANLHQLATNSIQSNQESPPLGPKQPLPGSTEPPTPSQTSPLPGTTDSNSQEYWGLESMLLDHRETLHAYGTLADFIFRPVNSRSRRTRSPCRQNRQLLADVNSCPDGSIHLTWIPTGSATADAQIRGRGRREARSEVRRNRDDTATVTNATEVWIDGGGIGTRWQDLIAGGLASVGGAGVWIAGILVMAIGMVLRTAPSVIAGRNHHVVLTTITEPATVQLPHLISVVGTVRHHMWIAEIGIRSHRVGITHDH